MKNFKKKILYGVLGVSLAGGIYALGRFTAPKADNIESNKTSISIDDELVEYLTRIRHESKE